MIPTDVSGSRFPGRLVADEERRVVDERARNRDALLLAARELVRKLVRLSREADEREHLGNLRADRAGGLALHLEGVGDVLRRRAVVEKLEVLEDAADVPRSIGTFEFFRRPSSRPPTMIRPDVGSSSFRRSRMIVDFPEPDGPTRKTNSPFSITNEASRRATMCGS
jgi:hypothetical protein